MAATLDIDALEGAVARTVERVKALEDDKKDLAKKLKAAEKKLKEAGKKLEKALSGKAKTDGAAEEKRVEEVRARLEKLEGDLSSLLESSDESDED